MAVVQCEDKTGVAEVVIFPRLYEKVASWLRQYSVFLIAGVVDAGSSEVCKLKAQSLIPLDLVLRDGYAVEAVTLTLPALLDQSLLDELKHSLKAGKVKLHFSLEENNKRLKIATKTTIAFSNEVGLAFEKHGFSVALACRS